jgi:hypothetical protein
MGKPKAAKLTEGKHSGLYFKPADLELIEALKKRLGLDRSEIVRLALRVLGREQGVVV